MAVLVSLLLPALQKVREASNRARCQNALKRWALGMHAHQRARGKLPLGGNRLTRTAAADPEYGRLRWPQQVWSYVGLGDRVPVPPPLARLVERAASEHDRGLVAQRDPLYYCPSDRPNAYYLESNGKWLSIAPFIIF